MSSEDYSSESEETGKVFADVPQFNVTDIYESALAPDPVSISFTISLQKAIVFYKKGICFSYCITF